MDAAKLTGYLEGLVDSLRANGQVALEHFDGVAVHKARVASRRLSAALEVLGPLASRKPRKALQKALRRNRHRLAPHRDLDVMLLRLAEIEGEGRLASGAMFLIQQFEHERDQLRASANLRVPTFKQWPALREELIEHSEGVAPVLAEAVHDCLEEVVRQAGLLASPHAVRGAFKDLRYAVELAGEAGMTDAAGLVDRFKAIQDVLGAWHDYAVIADRAIRLVRKAGLAFLADRDAQHLVELSLECLHKAQWKLGEFRALWAEEGAAIEGSVRAAFPLSRDLVADSDPHPCCGGNCIVDAAADPAETGATPQEVLP